jgi:hypothetical protein
MTALRVDLIEQSSPVFLERLAIGSLLVIVIDD